MKNLSENDKLKVVLRDVKMEDAAFLMELNNDPEIAKYVVGNPKQVTMQQQMLWMKNLQYEAHTKRFIIEYDKLSVGTIIISNIDLINLVANINIKLQYAARGKGIGKQSIGLALKYCFETMGIYCVTAHVLPFNKASLALFKSCGFIEEGVLRSRIIKNFERFDLISFSINYSDFKRTL